MLNLSNKRILVAGVLSATSRAMTKHLSETGATLILLDEDENNLREFAKELGDNCSLLALSFDNLLNGDIEASALFKEVGQINGFVFASGKGGVKPIAFNKPAFTKELIRSNYLFFAEMTRLLLKDKNLLNGSSVVALSSVSSIKGLKTKAAYCASKAALDACVRSYAAELA